MKQQLTFSEKYKSLHQIFSYLSDKNIEFFLNISGNPLNLTKRDVNEMMQNGFYKFITQTPDAIIEYFVDLTKYLESRNNQYVYDSWKNQVKVIYSFEEPMVDDLQVIEEKIIDLNSYDGITWMKNLYEAETPVKIHKICKWCDDISIRANGLNSGRSEESTPVFDGDCYMIGESFDAFRKQMIIATVGNYYKIPTYYELLWTEKYGYFNPKGELNFDEKLKPLRLGDFNYSERRYNDHVISLGAYCKYMGNIAVSNAFLKPVKQNEKEEK